VAVAGPQEKVGESNNGFSYRLHWYVSQQALLLQQETIRECDLLIGFVEEAQVDGTVAYGRR